MIDYRCEIAKKISDVTNISKEELANYIEKPKNSEMGANIHFAVFFAGIK